MRGGVRPEQGGVVVENALLERLQGGAGIGAGVDVQVPAGLPQGVQCLGLAATAIQAQGEEFPASLPVGSGVDRVTQGRDRSSARRARAPVSSG
jgi:hypothetical protein